jgi:hypothetical protein
MDSLNGPFQLTRHQVPSPASFFFSVYLLRGCGALNLVLDVVREHEHAQVVACHASW